MSLLEGAMFAYEDASQLCFQTSQGLDEQTYVLYGPMLLKLAEIFKSRKELLFLINSQTVGEQ